MTAVSTHTCSVRDGTDIPFTHRRCYRVHRTERSDHEHRRDSESRCRSRS